MSSKSLSGEPRKKMIIVQRYTAVDEGDLIIMLRPIFAPWVKVTFNNEVNSKDKEIDNEKSRRDNSGVNIQTA